MAVSITATKQTEISGHKFRDDDGNGVWNKDRNEPTMDGWAIQLLKDNQVVDQVYTGDSQKSFGPGEYKFSGELNGLYTIKEIQQPGYRQTRPVNPDYYSVNIDSEGITWSGSVDGIVYGGSNTANSFNFSRDLTCGGTVTVALDVYGKSVGKYTFSGNAVAVNRGFNFNTGISGSTITVTDEYGAPDNLDFGNYLIPPPTRISGHKFHDLNRNGAYDQGEQRLSGWTIKLSNGRTTVTNPNGYYEFNDLPYGDYRVEEVMQGNWVQTAPANPNYHSVTLNSVRDYVYNLDFGNYRPGGGGDDYGSISGYKFNDVNGNGLWDKDSEPALQGWTIKLSNGRTTLTDARGYYSFTRLPYGTYSVEEVQQSGWTMTAPSGGSYTAIVNSLRENHYDLNFGNTQGGTRSGRISGYKFNDVNGNGLWDKNSESALQGWTIKLSSGQTTVTDAQGYYSFTGLPYGQYKLEEVQQSMWSQTAPSSGSFDITIDSQNENHQNLNFGNRRSAIIIPPAGGPSPEQISVFPTSVPAGDPTITVKPAPGTTMVYAVLPDGKKLNLKQGQDGIWKVSFMVPFGTPDGPYHIRVYMADAAGMVRESGYQITIDNSLPLMKTKKVPLDNGQYGIQVTTLFNAVELYYLTSSGQRISFSRDGQFRWNAELPAGKGYILGIDESGYEVKHDFSLAVRPMVKKPDLQVQVPFGPMMKKIVTAGAVPQSEMVNNSGFSGNYAAWAAAALLAAVCTAVWRRRRIEQEN